MKSPGTGSDGWFFGRISYLRGNIQHRIRVKHSKQDSFRDQRFSQTVNNKALYHDCPEMVSPDFRVGLPQPDGTLGTVVC
jgi:hypothetical protein